MTWSIRHRAIPRQAVLNLPSAARTTTLAGEMVQCPRMTMMSLYLSPAPLRPTPPPAKTGSTALQPPSRPYGAHSGTKPVFDIICDTAPVRRQAPPENEDGFRGRLADHPLTRPGLSSTSIVNCNEHPGGFIFGVRGRQATSSTSASQINTGFRRHRKKAECR